MFFGDPVAAFAHMRRAANTGARMAFVCWRQLDENPWMQVPMNAVARHLPPRPKPVPNAPGMFAFADPRRVSEVLTKAGWAPPRLDKLDLDLDIAAGRGLEAAVVQSTQIGAINSWLRNQPAESAIEATQDNAPLRAVVLPPINEVIDLHSTHLAMARRHLPVLIMAVLLGTAAIGVGMIGFGNGRVGRRFSVLDSVYGVVLAVALWMTIDLDYPGIGLIRVSNLPVVETLAAMNRGVPAS
jgi:hypothetical protein